eukprot:scaffold207038_cov41-Attheya_sp.AAC.1
MVLAAEIVTMHTVTIRVEEMDIKDVLIKEDDIVRLLTKGSSSWTPSNNSRTNQAKNDPCHYQGNAHTWLKCYGNPDGLNYWPGFTPRPHGATGR